MTVAGMTITNIMMVIGIISPHGASSPMRHLRRLAASALLIFCVPAPSCSSSPPSATACRSACSGRNMHRKATDSQTYFIWPRLLGA